MLNFLHDYCNGLSESAYQVIKFPLCSEQRLLNPLLVLSNRQEFFSKGKQSQLEERNVDQFPLERNKRTTHAIIKGSGANH